MLKQGSVIRTKKSGNSPKNDKPIVKLKKTMFMSALCFSMVQTSFAADVFINEIHYDNAGSDIGEAVEVAGLAGVDLSGWQIVLYNGKGGASYNVLSLSGTIPDQQNGFGTIQFTYPSNGLQNGSPDGLALVDTNGNVAEFLSYEGSLTATNGPANGTISIDIGVAETGTTPIGHSLQFDGTSWQAARVSSFGSVNAGQIFDENGGDTGGSDGGSGGSDGDTGTVDGVSGTVCVNCPDLNKVEDSTSFDDATYYADVLSAVTGAHGIDAIKAAITTTITQNHKDLSYSEVWSALTETDEDPNNSDNVILFYRGISKPKLSNGSGAASSNPENWNREHVWAKSHGDFKNEGKSGYTDIHHLRPTDISVNSTRGNLDFDSGGTEIGEAPGNYVDSNSFEPRDSVKGDVARMIFYMDARYETADSNMPDLQVVESSNTSGPELGRLCRLIEWHNSDLVDEFEEKRNNTIYEYQGNRNPFIDHPEWVTTLHGSEACDTGGGDTGGGDTGGGDTGGGDTGGTGANSLIISGVFDAPLSGGTPKGIEIYVSKNVADMSTCGIGFANNGGGSDDEEFTFPETSATAGSYIYIASETTNFEKFFGFSPDYTTGNAAINGDDAIELFCDGQVIDVFGEINIDGTNQPWEYMDGWAYRNEGTEPNGNSFVIENWIFSGKNSFDGENDNATATTPFPAKTFVIGDPIVISGVFDGPLSGGTPKVLEFYVSRNISDIGVCGFGSANNGKGSDGEEFSFPTGPVAGGSYLYVATENEGFENFFGFLPDYISGAAAINGDDAIELYCNGEVVDTFGDINVDGSGKDWEYLDGWAYRNTDSNANGNTFVLENWEFSGINAMDGEANNASATTPFPIARYANGNQGGDGGDGGGSDNANLGQCNDPATLIHQVQGDSNTSPYIGQSHIIEGVVTFVSSSMDGFFIQEEDGDKDTNESTSEGVFVYNNANEITPVNGDVVRVVGEISEFFERTQLSATQDILVCGNASVTPSILSLPFNSPLDAEKLEGMSIETNSILTVSDNYRLGDYGEVQLSNGRLYIPTNVFLPNSLEAISLAERNSLNKVILDDNVNGKYPATIIYPTGGLSAQNTLRTGDTVTSLKGILDYSFSNYRVLPIETPAFAQENGRTETPVISQSNLKIASLNVLNLFNGDGLGGGFPTARGPDTFEEYERQVAKTVSAIISMDVDILGLMEIENDGFSATSTIADLVERLNVKAGAGTYAFVNAGAAIGTDAIAVGLIYKPNTVSTSGTVKLNNNPLFNRPPLAQSFNINADGSELVVVVNHFKSKGGCSSATGADKDQNDGQACFNSKRVAQSTELLNWLSTDSQLSSQPNVLIIGDLNSYAKEDPIRTITNGGFTNLIHHFGGANAYSYSYGGEAGYLDHALASSALMSKVTGATEWHINSDEPRVLDYNVENKTSQQQAEYYAPDAYRMSDHDPVIIGLNFTSASVLGDFDGDGDVDINDVRGLMSAIQHGKAIDLAFDLNNDNAISMFDARIMMSLCTRNRCAAN
jgi:predicted extracellular nuclease/endonuclease I